MDHFQNCLFLSILYPFNFRFSFYNFVKNWQKNSIIKIKSNFQFQPSVYLKVHSRCKYVLHAYFWKASPTQHVTNIMRDKLSSFTHKWKTRCSKKAKSLVLSSTFFVQKHSCLVFIFTTSSSRLDTSVEATNKGIWAQAEIEPYNLICCWDLLSTLGKSTFFHDIQKLTLNKDFFQLFVYII